MYQRLQSQGNLRAAEDAASIKEHKQSLKEGWGRLIATYTVVLKRRIKQTNPAIVLLLAFCRFFVYNFIHTGTLYSTK
jgi:hypothetical protein